MVHSSNTGYGEKQTMKADMVVHGAGRVPEIGNLDLEAAGVERQNIEVLRLTNIFMYPTRQSTQRVMQRQVEDCR